MVLYGKFQQKYTANAGVLQGSILDPALFGRYINDLPHDVICNITIYPDATTLYSKCDCLFDLWQELELISSLNVTRKTLQTMAGSCFLISILEKIDFFGLAGPIILGLLM